MSLKKVKQKKVLFLSIIIVLLLVGCQQKKFKNITIHRQKIKVEIAATTKAQGLGLSGRQSLAENRGMLFVFDKYFKPVFWMKDMRFPLDIIWIKDNIIVDITSNIPIPRLHQPLKQYRPKQNVNYVLEVNSGWSLRHHVNIGDKVNGLK